MKEKLKKFLRRRLAKFLLVPFLLTILWFGLTCLYIITFDTSLSVISYNHGRESFDKVTYSKLLKGDIISGHFTAAENNLGIVSIKFQTFIRPPYANEDTLVFRLKEAGSKSWYYGNSYRDGLVYEVPFFPFGFPKIANSKGKTYYFQVESLSGNVSNSVALSNRGQNLFSKYQASKSLLLHNKKELAIFIVKKFVSTLLTTDVRFSSFIYFLPLLFYLLWKSPFGGVIVEPLVNKINAIVARMVKSWLLKPLVPVVVLVKNIIVYNLHWIIIAVVIIDVFVTQLTNDMVYLVIILLWIITLKIYKMDSRYTFILALALLLISPVWLFIQDFPTAEKGAVWTYMFLIAGTIQLILEHSKGKTSSN